MYCVLKGSELFASLIFCISGVPILGNCFLQESFGMLIQGISVLRRAGKADVTVETLPCLLLFLSYIKCRHLGSCSRRIRIVGSEIECFHFSGKIIANEFS